MWNSLKLLFIEKVYTHTCEIQRNFSEKGCVNGHKKDEFFKVVRTSRVAL